MRIALLHYTLPPVIGGVERVVGQQAATLRALGHEVVVLDAAGWRAAVDSLAAELPWAAVVIHNVMTMPFDLEWRRQLVEWVERCPRVNWVNWVHDVALLNPAYAAMTDDERGELGQLPEGLRHVAVSAVRASEFAGAIGLDEGVVEVISNGLFLGEWVGLTDRLRERLDGVGWWTADLVLLHPTRLVRRKRIEYGLEVVAGLERMGVRVRYCVTAAADPHQGDGALYLAELQKQVEALGIEDSVMWLGLGQALSDVEVRCLYQLADALFFPSASEGFGLPLIEALTLRLPVWCSDLLVHREVMGSDAEFFGGEEEADSVAKRLKNWAAEGGSSRRRKRMHELDGFNLCKERLEPLLAAGNG